MKRRDFLEKTAATPLLNIPQLTKEDSSIEDVEKVVSSMPEETLNNIEVTNPNRGDTFFYNGVAVGDIQDIEFDDNLDLVRKALDPGQEPNVENKHKKQYLTQYKAAKERELDLTMHYFGVDKPQAQVLEASVENAFPRMELDIKSLDETGTWQENQGFHQQNVSPILDILGFDSGYEDGLPNNSNLVEDGLENPYGVDAFIYMGEHGHGAGSPGGSASIEVAPQKDAEEIFNNNRVTVHELGHTIYGLPHHYTEGAMSYNGELKFKALEKGDKEDFMEFGTYSQPQIERGLNGEIKLAENALGHSIVYEDQDRDPRQYSQVFLDNMKNYMEQMTHLKLEENHVEWTPIKAEYTEEMDKAWLQADNQVVEIGVHKDQGFNHEQAYTKIIS